MLAIRDLDSSPVEATPPERLPREALDRFERDGLLFVPGLFSADELAPLRRVEGSAAVHERIARIFDSTGEAAELFGWSGGSDDVLGVYVRIARMVEIAQDLLGGEAVYHWHSKLSFKRPHTEGKWDWHQDYGSWYLEGCLRPTMLTVMVAVDPCTVDNGCVQLVRGSNRLGRIDHCAVGQAQGADPAVVEHALETLERVHCVLEPGDAVAFHSNTLHASGPNHTDSPRTVLHISYNTVSNAPRDPIPVHAYSPLAMLPDDVLRTAAHSAEIDLESWSRHREEWEAHRQRRGNVYGYRSEGVKS